MLWFLYTQDRVTDDSGEAVRERGLPQGKKRQEHRKEVTLGLSQAGRSERGPSATAAGGGGGGLQG